MLFKAVFLFSVVAGLAFGFQETPEDLKVYFQKVWDSITAYQHEAMISIRDTSDLMHPLFEPVKRNIMKELSSAAKPYWEKIESIEQEAKAKGQDFSQCINLGNDQLYHLNNTVIDHLYWEVDYWFDLANSTVNFAYDTAYSVVQELLAFESRVRYCKDDSCATELKQNVTKFSKRGMNTIVDSVERPYNIIQVLLPEILNHITLDEHQYRNDSSKYIDMVNDCINNL